MPLLKKLSKIYAGLLVIQNSLRTSTQSARIAVNVIAVCVIVLPILMENIVNVPHVILNAIHNGRTAYAANVFVNTAGPATIAIVRIARMVA